MEGDTWSAPEPLFDDGWKIPGCPVNGPAIGLGCDLACLADMRIASDRAKFGVTFLKLGIIPGDGGAWFLQRILGYSRAAEPSFTGDMIDARMAREIGLVNHVTKHERLLEEAHLLAGRIAANPVGALRMTKRLMREAQHSRLDTILEMSAAYQAITHSSAEHEQAVAAFLATKD